ncbi:MAG: sulfatase-like hydrolase/transferase [Planctomycetota bacterium]
MKCIHKWTAILVCCFCLELCAADAPPNVIFIVADDLGYGDLACYGSSTNKTPHIDELAQQGVRFTDFHSSGPMCTPTRVSILTGQYQQRFGAVFDGPLSGESQRHLGLPTSAVTVAEHVKRKGYATACFGKWHLGFRPPTQPTDQGFDEFRGLLAGDGDHHSHIDRYGNEDWWHNDQIAMESGYTADLLTRYSIEFIHRNRERPFFLYLPHLAIHFPWQGPNDPAHRESGKDYKQDKWGVIPNRSDVRPHIQAMVESIDDSTGRILAELRRLELTDRTVVIFTSDNGGYLTYGREFKNISSNGRLRGQKGELYEGGHRVPLIVSCPTRISPAVSDSLTHSNDFLPTICSLAGIDSVESDGVDLSPLLFEKKKLDERTLYWRAGKEWAVRRGKWKLVYEQGRQELFNLHDDVGEQSDQRSKQPEFAKQLADDWRRWDESIRAERLRVQKRLEN